MTQGLPEGYLTIYGFAQMLNRDYNADIRPQTLYQAAKRDKKFPAIRHTNGTIIVNVAEGLTWWEATSGKRSGPGPDKTRTEPFMGWKYLGITPEFMLRPSIGDIYGVDVFAVCHGSKKRKPHDVTPAWNCTCGLYAYKERPMPELRMFLAQVELRGRVIEAKLGYRAQFQRVLGLYVVQLCNCCAPATGFRTDNWHVVPGCEEHATMTLAELQGNVGTEVRWLRA